MANLSKSSFFDASKPPVRRVMNNIDGVRIEERLPTGVQMEIWIDNDGNEVVLGMTERGRAPSRVDIDAARAKFRAQGFIEQHRCPITQGTVGVGDVPANLRQPCAEGSYGPRRPCPHVLHAMNERRAAAEAKRQRREAAANATRLRAEAIETQRLDEQRRQTEAVIDLARAVVTKAGKDK